MNNADYSDFQYIETAYGGLTHRNKIQTLEQARDVFNRLSKKNECYTSHFLFKKEILTHIKATRGSVEGFNGECYSGHIWVDIDRDDESLQKRIELAQQGAQEYVSRLKTDYHIDPNILDIYFTGAKGFCIGLPTELLDIPPSKNFNQIIKGIVSHLVDGKIKVDPVVYDKTRLWRVPGSLNKKAQLYKIPLTAKELFTLTAQDIIVMAEEPREIQKSNGALEVNESLRQIYLQVEKELQDQTAQSHRVSPPFDASQPPHKTKLCFWKTLNTGVSKGERNYWALRLSVHLQKTQKLSRDIARAVLIEWDRKNRPPLSSESGFPKRLERYLDDGLKYDYGCRDELLKGQCDERCYLFKKKERIFQVMTARQLEALELPEQAPIIDKGILPAQAGMIWSGASEMGKSLIVLEGSIRLCHGMDFLGFEVPKPRAVLLVQKENALVSVKYRIRRICEGLDLPHAPENLHLTSVKERFNLAQYSDQERLREHISNTQAEVVILDPLSSFHRGDENDNMGMRAVLDNLTDISRLLECAFIVVHHYGKQPEYRGASSIKDWADTLIGYEAQYHIQRIIRKVKFEKVRNGPKPRPILIERDYYHFTHKVIEEETLCSPEKVKEILDEMGGSAESKKVLTKEIMADVKCSSRTARRAIERAIEERYIQEVGDEQDKRKSRIVSK